MRRIVLVAGLALACSGCAYGPDYAYPGYGYYGGYGYPAYPAYPAYGSYAYGYGYPYGYAPYWGPAIGVGAGVVSGNDYDRFRRFGEEHRLEERRFGENRGQAFWQHGEARSAPVPHNAPAPRVAAPAPQLPFAHQTAPPAERRSGSEQL
jgi:hypothetical protein